MAEIEKGAREIGRNSCHATREVGVGEMDGRKERMYVWGMPGGKGEALSRKLRKAFEGRKKGRKETEC